MVSSISKFTPLKIPLDEISSATNNFADENLIGQGAFGKVYKGRLWWSEQWIDISARRLDRRYGLGEVEFWSEISMLFSLEHANLASIFGVCDEEYEKIIINKFERYGSLQEYLSGSTLTWMQRLKICVGVAHALRYLHDRCVIHHNINSSTILLDDNWEAKLSGFEYSMKNPSTRNDQVLLVEVGGVRGYVDPEHEKTGGVTYKSDIFSFGVVLFEILCGRRAFIENNHHQFLAPLARLHYGKKKVLEIVDPGLWKTMDPQSLLVFSQIAYSCVEVQGAQRPGMDDIVNELEKAYNLQWNYEQPTIAAQPTSIYDLEKGRYWISEVVASDAKIFYASTKKTERKLNQRNTKSSISKFDHLRIPLKEISSATNGFADANLIGRGALGKVYKGRLWWSEQWIAISARRLDRKYGLGDVEFWAEISMLSSLEHRNIVSIIGFCDEKDEKDDKEVKIIINKHDTKGSLQEYLSGSTLTWMQRLRICVGIAHALRYLHKSSVIHHNINSSTILLDKNREAKLSGFEYSMKYPSGRDDRILLTEFSGTRGYEDPEYEKTGGVTYKSDVFSLGVVLFETLCGRKAFIPNDHDHRFLAPMARLHYDKNKLHEIVHPDLWKNMDPQSFLIFSQIADSCLKEQRANRPNMDKVFDELEKAFHLQLKHENPVQSTVAVQLTPSNYWEDKHLEHLKIQLKDILLATEDFSNENCIGLGTYSMVYKAELVHFDSYSFSSIDLKNEGELPKRSSNVAIKRIFRRQDDQWFKEIEMLSSCKHRNIISLLGFCDEGTEMIIVYEYASKGRLDDYLGGTSNLPWGLRLKICLDIARGLNYLHTNTEEKQRIIHRDIKSDNILLGNNWEAKLSAFGPSEILPPNQQDNTLYVDVIAGTHTYMDPEYLETGKLKTESDTYSFGVVLFEILCERLAYDVICLGENDEGFASIARRCIDEGTLKKMIDPKLKDDIDLNKGPNQHSLEIFSKVAYQCLAETQVERPTMEIVIKELEKALHFHENRTISLEDIKSATRNFSHENYIGGGGSAMAYKGEFQHADGRNYTLVAKRLKRSHHGQERQQFLTERQILLQYKHTSIIRIVGYCDEMDENIIVFEHMSNGSLDMHLKNVSLTWIKRLEICIDVASGLDFLHGGGVTHEVVIHRDIKSANILLNGDWNAKIADFGLSLITSIDKETDFVINRVGGTQGYWDPLYKTSGLLTRESDVYSFGVVLFEILSGRLVYKRDNEEFLTMLVKNSFQEGKLDEVVFDGIKEQIAPKSLMVFQMIAYQCLLDEREQRPTANRVLVQLKKALEFQVNNDNQAISLEGIKSATQDFSAENYLKALKLKKKKAD